jgi:hypothetical protein
MSLNQPGADRRGIRRRFRIAFRGIHQALKPLRQGGANPAGRFDRVRKLRRMRRRETEDFAPERARCARFGGPDKPDSRMRINNKALILV